MRLTIGAEERNARAAAKRERIRLVRLSHDPAGERIQPNEERPGISEVSASGLEQS